MPVCDWREYEEKVASFFRTLGCSAGIAVVVPGVRASHEVDVWVEYKRLGIEQHWAIECKNWKTRVPKEKVLVLKALVEDVGADRGVLVSEAGFQKGAYEAATRSNITLTTFAKLKELAKDDLLKVSVEQIERRLIKLKEEMAQLGSPENGTGSNMKGWFTIPAGTIENMGQIAALEMGLDGFKMGRFPAPVRFDESGSKLIRATTREEFVGMAGEVVERIERWLAEQKK